MSTTHIGKGGSMLINYKRYSQASMVILSLLLYPTISLSADTVKAYDDPVQITVIKNKPVFTIKEESTAGYVWFLENYDNKLLTLKEHKYLDGEESWKFSVAPEAFVAPHIIKFKLMLGDPEVMEDYEEHLYIIKTATSKNSN